MNSEELAMSTFNTFKSMHEEKRSTLIQRLAGNVTYEFAWIGEELFYASFKADQYAYILHVQVTNECSLQEALTHQIESLERYISNEYNVRENSSGSLHKEVSTWKFIASMQLIKELKSI